jgi:general secretion pathway protein K
VSPLPIRQRGVALLVALLVVALAVILIAALLDRGELALARTRNVLRSEQAEAYAQGLETYAAQILATTALNNGADTNASPWALPLPPQPVPGGMISATMRDLNGCFNLNNLGPRSLDAGASLKIFQALLMHLGIDPGLAEAVKSWANVGGDDASYYLALPIPYRPRHGAFAHVSELRLVRGVSGDVYARLAPYVCALPPGTTINVNTASAPVLWSLDNTLSQAAAEKLWSNGQANYQEIGKFVTDAKAAGAMMVQTPSSLLAITSTYFLARGDIVLDDVPFTFYSLIERGGSAGGIHVLERSRGSDDALVAPAPVATGRKGETTPR